MKDGFTCNREVRTRHQGFPHRIGTTVTPKTTTVYHGQRSNSDHNRVREGGSDTTWSGKRCRVTENVVQGLTALPTE